MDAVSVVTWADGNVPRVRIVVCVKHVPDIQSERALGPDGRVVRDGGDGTINELDENAVEAALALVEASDGSVVALTVGPADAADAVRRGLQLGADEAVHVVDDAIAGSDVIGTARVLAAAVRHLDAQEHVDLVITGMAGLDGLTSLLPTALAELLDLPALPLAAELTVEGSTVRVRRNLDHASEVLEATLPALVSVTDQANEPRYPNFKGIMAARKKPITTLTLADLEVDASRVGALGARTEVLEAAARPPRDNRVLVQDTGDAGIRLAAYLVDNQLV
nr:electron transfer flavoprotein subunit beta/FixA family protein [Cellulomonas humilata]